VLNLASEVGPVGRTAHADAQRVETERVAAEHAETETLKEQTKQAWRDGTIAPRQPDSSAA